jgi:hypothetical protein
MAAGLRLAVPSFKLRLPSVTAIFFRKSGSSIVVARWEKEPANPSYLAKIKGLWCWDSYTSAGPIDRVEARITGGDEVDRTEYITDPYRTHRGTVATCQTLDGGHAPRVRPCHGQAAVVTR